MKSNFKRLLSSLLIIYIMVLTVFPAYAGQDGRGVSNYNHIISNLAKNDIQNWIDKDLSSGAGVISQNDWYILAISQSKKISGKSYNFDKYESSLKQYISQNSANINATSKQRIALVLASIGSTDNFIQNTVDTTIGKQGIMSNIFGLHLLNNGYKSSTHSVSSVTTQLLNSQCNDGGWSLSGKNGVGDNDVTAMAIQSLAPQYNQNQSVKRAIDSALNLLSTNQSEDGSFTAVNGNKVVKSCETTSQVICALSSLKIDCINDQRFIKNNNNLFDGLDTFKTSNGFSHTQGNSTNAMATNQVFYTSVCYNRLNNLFILDNVNLSQNKAEVEQNTKEEVTVKSENKKSNNIVSENSVSQKENETEVSTITEISSEYISEKDTSNANIGQNNIQTKNGKSNYKIWAILGIIIIAIIICVILHYSKKGNKGNYIIVAIASVVAIIIVIMTNFQSVSNHNIASPTKESPIGTVTISIECGTISNEIDDSLGIKNGVILDATEIEIESGETVYDILTQVCDANSIQYETNGSTDSIYVEGINHIYELEYGDLSGWMYHVNSQEPNTSCSNYILEPNDNIEWLYTKDLGKDL